jgi:Mg2+ and Co2+ transporter CorA
MEDKMSDLVSTLTNMAANSAGGTSSLMDQLSGLDPNSKDYSQQLQILTTKINQMTEATQMISNMLKSLHDMAEGIIANMK